MYKTVVFLGYNVELVVSYKDVQRLKDFVRKQLPGVGIPLKLHNLQFIIIVYVKGTYV